MDIDLAVARGVGREARPRKGLENHSRLGSGSAAGAARPELEVGRGEDRSDRIRGEEVVEFAAMRRAQLSPSRSLPASGYSNLPMPESRSSGAIRSDGAAAGVGGAARSTAHEPPYERNGMLASDSAAGSHGMSASAIGQKQVVSYSNCAPVSGQTPPALACW
jgi:hypothetical protein